MTNAEIEKLRDELTKLDTISNFEQVRQAIWLLADALDKVLVDLKSQNRSCEHVWELRDRRPGYTQAYARCMKCGATL